MNCDSKHADVSETVEEVCSCAWKKSRSRYCIARSPYVSLLGSVESFISTAKYPDPADPGGGAANPTTAAVGLCISFCCCEGASGASKSQYRGGFNVCESEDNANHLFGWL